jgi:hypothetical protein
MNKEEGDNIARTMAANAMIVAQAQGAILNALLAVLRGENILPQSKIETVFSVAVASVDAMLVTDDAQQQAKRGLREVIAGMAQSFGITIPPATAAERPKSH